MLEYRSDIRVTAARTPLSTLKTDSIVINLGLDISSFLLDPTVVALQRLAVGILRERQREYRTHEGFSCRYALPLPRSTLLYTSANGKDLFTSIILSLRVRTASPLLGAAVGIRRVQFRGG